MPIIDTDKINSNSKTMRNNQIPRNNNQTMTNHQIPITKQNHYFWSLVIGYWNLFGNCILGIGHFIRISNFALRILIIAICLSGCVQKNDLERAKTYARQAESRYRQAVAQFKQLISKAKAPDELYLGLGRLYYSHGDFENAIAAFKKSASREARKFLAISYYRLGDFTDALEVFERSDIDDAEYRYYQALTCEKLNLFEQALKLYRKIKNAKFAALARRRIEAIEKEGGAGKKADLSPEIKKFLAFGRPEDYPQAGALILSCKEEIEVTGQNTEVFSLHYLIKILNQRGKEKFAETKIDYDSTYEKVELEYARTIKPDGTAVEVGSRHIRNVSKYLNFPLYSNARVYIISFPEVQEGSIIEYKLKLYRSRLLNEKEIAVAYPLQSSEPILAATFSIALPEGRKLNIKTLNERYNDFGANLAPQVAKEKGRAIYSWEFTNIAQIIPESNMPPATEINPTLFLSTFSQWQEVYDWWWALARDKLKADKQIKDKVKELTKDKPSAEEKIRAIYNFCAQKIRYVAVEYGQAGYEPHPAALIFKNKYGDCKDQAVLLAAMLKEAGIESSLVLIGTRQYYNLQREFPCVLFNHCIAAAELDGKTVFLDPTAETCSFGDLPEGDQQRRVLLFREGGYKIEETPLYPAGHNLLKQELSIKINKDESISGQKSVFTYGLYDQAQRYWLLYTQPELVREALKERIQDISIGARLLEYDIKNLDDLNQPVALSYDFTGPEYLTNAGFLRIMPQLAGLDNSLVAKERRRYAIDFGVLESRESAFKVEIPANFVVKYLPESISEESPWLKVEFAYSSSGEEINFYQKSQLKKRLVSAGEYAEFKNFFEGVARKIKQRVVLERKK